MEIQLGKQESDRKVDAKMGEKIKKLKEEHKQLIQQLQKAKQMYETKLSQRVQKETIVAEWLQEIKVTYTSELGDLAKKNAELMAANEVLLQQVSALRKIKDKLKSLQADDDELNLDDVFISSDSLDTIKEDLLQIGNLIGEGIKEGYLVFL